MLGSFSKKEGFPTGICPKSPQSQRISVYFREHSSKKDSIASLLLPVIPNDHTLPNKTGTLFDRKPWFLWAQLSSALQLWVKQYCSGFSNIHHSKEFMWLIPQKVTCTQTTAALEICTPPRRLHNLNWLFLDQSATWLKSFQPGQWSHT